MELSNELFLRWLLTIPKTSRPLLLKRIGYSLEEEGVSNKRIIKGLRQLYSHITVNVKRLVRNDYPLCSRRENVELKKSKIKSSNKKSKCYKKFILPDAIERYDHTSLPIMSSDSSVQKSNDTEAINPSNELLSAVPKDDYKLSSNHHTTSHKKDFNGGYPKSCILVQSDLKCNTDSRVVEKLRNNNLKFTHESSTKSNKSCKQLSDSVQQQSLKRERTKRTHKRKEIETSEDSADKPPAKITKSDKGHKRDSIQVNETSNDNKPGFIVENKLPVNNDGEITTNDYLLVSVVQNRKCTEIEKTNTVVVKDSTDNIDICDAKEIQDKVMQKDEKLKKTTAHSHKFELKKNNSKQINKNVKAEKCSKHRVENKGRNKKNKCQGGNNNNSSISVRLPKEENIVGGKHNHHQVSSERAIVVSKEIEDTVEGFIKQLDIGPVINCEISRDALPKHDFDTKKSETRKVTSVLKLHTTKNEQKDNESKSIYLSTEDKIKNISVSKNKLCANQLKSPVGCNYYCSRLSTIESQYTNIKEESVLGTKYNHFKVSNDGAFVSRKLIVQTSEGSTMLLDEDLAKDTVQKLNTVTKDNQKSKKTSVLKLQNTKKEQKSEDGKGIHFSTEDKTIPVSVNENKLGASKIKSQVECDSYCLRLSIVDSQHKNEERANILGNKYNQLPNESAIVSSIVIAQIPKESTENLSSDPVKKCDITSGTEQKQDSITNKSEKGKVTSVSNFQNTKNWQKNEESKVTDSSTDINTKTVSLNENKPSANQLTSQMCSDNYYSRLSIIEGQDKHFEKVKVLEKKYNNLNVPNESLNENSKLIAQTFEGSTKQLCGDPVKKCEIFKEDAHKPDPATNKNENRQETLILKSLNTKNGQKNEERKVIHSKAQDQSKPVSIKEKQLCANQLKSQVGCDNYRRTFSIVDNKNKIVEEANIVGNKYKCLKVPNVSSKVIVQTSEDSAKQLGGDPVAKHEISKSIVQPDTKKCKTSNVTAVVKLQKTNNDQKDEESKVIHFSVDKTKHVCVNENKPCGNQLKGQVECDYYCSRFSIIESQGRNVEDGNIVGYKCNHLKVLNESKIVSSKVIMQISEGSNNKLGGNIVTKCEISHDTAHKPDDVTKNNEKSTVTSIFKLQNTNNGQENKHCKVIQSKVEDKQTPVSVNENQLYTNQLKSQVGCYHYCTRLSIVDNKDKNVEEASFVGDTGKLILQGSTNYLGRDPVTKREKPKDTVQKQVPEKQVPDTNKNVEEASFVGDTGKLIIQGSTNYLGRDPVTKCEKPKDTVQKQVPDTNKNEKSKITLFKLHKTTNDQKEVDRKIVLSTEDTPKPLSLNENKLCKYQLKDKIECDNYFSRLNYQVPSESEIISSKTIAQTSECSIKYILDGDNFNNNGTCGDKQFKKSINYGKTNLFDTKQQNILNKTIESDNDQIIKLQSSILRLISKLKKSTKPTLEINLVNDKNVVNDTTINAACVTSDSSKTKTVSALAENGKPINKSRSLYMAAQNKIIKCNNQLKLFENNLHKEMEDINFSNQSLSENTINETKQQTNGKSCVTDPNSKQINIVNEKIVSNDLESNEYNNIVSSYQRDEARNVLTKCLEDCLAGKKRVAETDNPVVSAKIKKVKMPVTSNNEGKSDRLLTPKQDSQTLMRTIIHNLENILVNHNTKKIITKSPENEKEFYKKYTNSCGEESIEIEGLVSKVVEFLKTKQVNKSQEVDNFISDQSLYDTDFETYRNRVMESVVYCVPEKVTVLNDIDKKQLTSMVKNVSGNKKLPEKVTDIDKGQLTSMRINYTGNGNVAVTEAVNVPTDIVKEQLTSMANKFNGNKVVTVTVSAPTDIHEGHLTFITNSCNGNKDVPEEVNAPTDIARRQLTSKANYCNENKEVPITVNVPTDIVKGQLTYILNKFNGNKEVTVTVTAPTDINKEWITSITKNCNENKEVSEAGNVHTDIDRRQLTPRANKFNKNKVVTETVIVPNDVDKGQLTSIANNCNRYKEVREIITAPTDIDKGRITSVNRKCNCNKELLFVSHVDNQKQIDDQFISETIDLYLSYFEKSSDHLTSVPVEVNQSINNLFSTNKPHSEHLSVPAAIQTYLNLYNAYFNDYTNTIINKIAEVLHLAISDFNTKEHRIHLALKLNSDLQNAEIKRANNDYGELLSLRRDSFHRMFQLLISKIEQSECLLMATTLYFKINQALLHIDLENIKYYSIVRKVMTNLLKTNCKQIGGLNNFFSLSESKLTGIYNFIKHCLVAYDLAKYRQADTNKENLFLKYILYEPTSVELKNMVYDFVVKHDLMSRKLFIDPNSHKGESILSGNSFKSTDSTLTQNQETNIAQCIPREMIPANNTGNSYKSCSQVKVNNKAYYYPLLNKEHQQIGLQQDQYSSQNDTNSFAPRQQCFQGSDRNTFSLLRIPQQQQHSIVAANNTKGIIRQLIVSKRHESPPPLISQDTSSTQCQDYNQQRFISNGQNEIVIVAKDQERSPNKFAQLSLSNTATPGQTLSISKQIQPQQHCSQSQSIRLVPVTSLIINDGKQKIRLPIHQKRSPESVQMATPQIYFESDYNQPVPVHSTSQLIPIVNTSSQQSKTQNSYCRRLPVQKPAEAISNNKPSLLYHSTSFNRSFQHRENLYNRTSFQNAGENVNQFSTQHTNVTSRQTSVNRQEQQIHRRLSQQEDEVNYSISVCAVKDCGQPISVTCSLCAAVFYCSRNCQINHWYSDHSTLHL